MTDSSPASPAPAPADACYHCGLPVPVGADYVVAVDAAPRRMCCAGCQAVAQAIVANGLESYYRHRDALPESPAARREALPDELARLGLFDHPDVQKSFVRPVAEHEREAALILEGITCAACVWLNESHVRAQPGVTAVDINYATRRARVRWDERTTKLSAILQAIADIGYSAHPYDVARSESLARKERKAALWRLFVAGFGAMQVMMNAVPAYLANGDMTADISQLLRWASLILTLPVVAYSAAPFFRNAWRDLGLRRLGMDVPVALGIAVAFAASVWATLTATGEVYFDSVTMFVFFLLAGRYFEMMARQRATRGVEALAKALPALAWRLPAGDVALDGDAEQVAVADLAVGEHVRVKPGETVPADGAVVAGASRIDESLLTGESRPVDKRVGDALIGGTLNVASPLVMVVERVGDATRVAAIQRLMERAVAEKPRLVELADRVAARFVLVLLLLAVGTAAYWGWRAPDEALRIFVSVLVVSCPCALSLATPAALTVATGALARQGLLVTRGHAIETLARVTRVVFDKTGTLTLGQFRLVDVQVTAGAAGHFGTRDALLALAGALEAASEHPIGRALCDAARTLPAGLPAPRVSELRSVAGAGVEGVVDGEPWRLGSADYVGALVRPGGVAASPNYSHGDTAPNYSRGDTAQAGSVVYLGNAAGVWATFVVADALRHDARATVAALAALNMNTTLLSGDAVPAAQRVAAEVGIADGRGGCSPESKHAAVTAMQAAGDVVAMVGDGVNDAPVLAQAQVSVAMAKGADLARAHADVVLLGEALSPLSGGIVLARRTLRIVRQNLAWAAAYNALAVPAAMAGWVTPWMAGIGMSASSLFVVLNALRLQRN